jgi:uncharacterized membrane protein YphA (DoxX/SURF4 family)
MRTNPILDTWQFFVGLGEAPSGDGAPSQGSLILFLVMLTAAIGIAFLNWREPTQRTRAHIVTCVCRILVGCMWFQSSLVKLPLPVSDQFQHIVERMQQYAAFAVHREIVAQFYVPHLATLGPLVFLAEMSFAISFILGLAVPIFAPLAALFSLHLWLGLYTDPNEWPWTFVFVAVVHTLFILGPAGRSLGLDAFLHRHDVTGFRRAFG